MMNSYRLEKGKWQELYIFLSIRIRILHSIINSLQVYLI